MKKVNIKGVELFPFTSPAEIANYALAHPALLVAVNAEKIVRATDDMRRLINANIGYCDGAGPLMALHRMGHRKAIKVAGCELWLRVVERFYRQKTFYLIGARPQILEETVERLRSSYEGIRIVGSRDGYLSTEAEEEALVADVQARKPDVVFVAMGSPRQERLMERLQAAHKAVYMGLGGSFDVFAGSVRRAPRWWIDHNVEWLYRLVCQPRRIARQIVLLKFGWWLVSGSFDKKV